MLDINPVFPGLEEIIIIITVVVTIIIVIIIIIIITIIIIIICIDKDTKIFELLSNMVGQMTTSF